MLDARSSQLYFLQRGLPAIAGLLVRSYTNMRNTDDAMTDDTCGHFVFTGWQALDVRAQHMAPSGECYHLIYQFRRFVYMNINLVG